MTRFRLGFGLVCLAIVGPLRAQAPAPPSPPAPQKLPMAALRPIRIPQLAPLEPVQVGPYVRPPLAPPSDQFQVHRPPQVISPPGITGRAHNPFQNHVHAPITPGQPLQPLHGISQPQPVQVYQPPPPAQPAHYLTWSAERLETNAEPGQTSVQFTFWLTNVSTEVVAINAVHTSCGCTVAQLPSQPWQIDPGSNGPITVTMNLAGKFGSIEKAVTVNSTCGFKPLVVKANIPQQPNAQPAIGGIDPERLKNMQMALADRQVLFKGECAKCHAEPAIGKTGEPLYAAACGICHDSTHRAAMVPDLKKLIHPTNEEYWRKWIRSGRVGSMMPAFAKAEGGPLSDEQIESLVKFLNESITVKADKNAAPSASQLKPQAGPSGLALPASANALSLQQPKLQ